MIIQMFIFYLFYAPFLLYGYIRSELIIRSEYKHYINALRLKIHLLTLQQYKKQFRVLYHKMDMDFWTENKGHREVFSIWVWLLIITIIYNAI